MRVPSALRSEVLKNSTTQLCILLCQVCGIVAIISHYLLENQTITFVDSILRCHVKIIIGLNLGSRVNTLLFQCQHFLLAIRQHGDVLLEVLDIVEQRVCSYLYLFRFVEPLLCFLRVVSIGSLEIVIEFCVTRVRCFDRGVQTFVHQRKTTEDIRTYVQRQHSGEHQVHHTYHLLSRGFRTVLCSTHF